MTRKSRNFRFFSKKRAEKWVFGGFSWITKLSVSDHFQFNFDLYDIVELH